MQNLCFVCACEKGSHLTERYCILKRKGVSIKKLCTFADVIVNRPKVLHFLLKSLRMRRCNVN